MIDADRAQLHAQARAAQRLEFVDVNLQRKAEFFGFLQNAPRLFQRESAVFAEHIDEKWMSMDASDEREQQQAAFH